MRAFFLVSLMILGSAVYADSHCRPSMTTDEAKAEFDAGVRALEDQVARDDQAAATEYIAATTEQQQRYNQRTSVARETFDRELAAVRAEGALDWREKIDAAAERFNQTTQVAMDQYNHETREARDIYTQRVADARANFDLGVKRLQDRYAKATCANP